MQESEQHWDLQITPKDRLLTIDWQELWRYRDLCAMLVRCDIVMMYNRTLDPLWFITQPGAFLLGGRK